MLVSSRFSPSSPCTLHTYICSSTCSLRRRLPLFYWLTWKSTLISLDSSSNRLSIATCLGSQPSTSWPSVVLPFKLPALELFISFSSVLIQFVGITFLGEVTVENHVPLYSISPFPRSNQFTMSHYQCHRLQSGRAGFRYVMWVRNHASSKRLKHKIPFYLMLKPRDKHTTI